MKVKRYFGNNMNEVMAKIREEVGADAVILSTRAVRQKGIQGIFAKPLTEVMVAYEESLSLGGAPGRAAESIFATRAEPVSARAPAQPSVKARPAEGAKPKPAEEPKAVFKPKKDAVPPPREGSAVTKPQFEVISRGEAGGGKHPASPAGRSAPREAEPARAGAPAGIGIGMAPAGVAAPPRPVHDSASADLEKKVDRLALMLDRLAHRIEGDAETGFSSPQAAKAAAGAAPASGTESPMARMLREQEVEAALAHRLIASAAALRQPEDDDPQALERAVIEALGEPQPIGRSPRGQTIIMLAGPTGVGKTTSLIKLAAQFVVKEELKVGLINADTYRIGAKEQIATYAEILEIPLSVVYSVDGLIGAMKAQADRDVLFIDTAGKKPSDEQHKHELQKIVETCDPDELFLVVSASTGNRAIREIIANYSFLGRYKLIVTKLDEVTGVGAVLNAGFYSGMPVSFLAGGQRVPEDIMLADPSVVADAFFGRSRVW